MLDLTGKWPYIMPDKRDTSGVYRLRCGKGALAQRESTTLTSWGSQVQSLYAPPSENQASSAFWRCFAFFLVCCDFFKYHLNIDLV
jgi:hypothetical protein